MAPTALVQAAGLALSIVKFDTLEDVLQTFLQSHFKRCIAAFHTPQEVGELAPSQDELKRIITAQATPRIRDAALGKLFAGAALTLTYTSSSKAEDNTNANSSGYDQLAVLLQAELRPKSEFNAFVADHVPIFTHIETEKASGAIMDDPAWDWDEASNADEQWMPAVYASIDVLKNTFVAACNAMQWPDTVSNAPDVELLAAFSINEVADVFHQVTPHKLTAVPQGPQALDENGQAAPVQAEQINAEQYATIGSRSRDRLLADLRSKATTGFNQANFAQAESLFALILRVLPKDKDTDPSLHLNRAAALLKLQRYEETIEASTRALELLKEPVDDRSVNLVWKGHMRRGAAHKALSSTKTEHVEHAQKDFEAAIKLNPADSSAQTELDTLRKPTVLSSPFFRSEILTALLRDELAAPAFPLSALLDLVSPSATLDSLPRATGLAPAIQAASAVLAKQEHHPTRLLLGALTMLDGQLTRADADLQLVSRALRSHSPTSADDVLSETKGSALLLLHRCAEALGKAQDAERYARWLQTWRGAGGTFRDGIPSWFESVLNNK